ncbi:hypothetical protein AB0A05_25495 [Streptomyces sp. NPDC046374]|uniref:hypothetical protein n=1 Tax=Streptomyces sp. NPDC046374 TaxID=3154917 RepID=UPI0033EE1921
MPRTGHRPRRILPCVLAGLLAAAGCTSGGGAPPAPSATSSAPAGREPDRQHPVLAYLRYEKPSAMAVMLADSAGRTWRAAEATPVDSPVAGSRSWPSRLVWSPDASRLAWIDSDMSYDTGQIHLLDVRSGRKTERPCPCSGIGFLGDDAVSLSNDGSSLLLFPPQGNPRRIALSERQHPYSKLAAGGTDDVTLFSHLPDAPDVLRGQGTLGIADRHGTVRPLLPDRGRTTLTQARRQPGGRGLAWANHDSGGVCGGMENVFTEDVTTAAPRRAIPSDTAFRHTLVSEGRQVNSLEWAGDGLTVTYGALPGCNVMYPERTASYYLRDGRWTYLGSGMLGIALGASGRVVRLEEPVYPDYSSGDHSQPGTGTLTLTSGGRKHVLGRGVSHFALTPAESAAAGPPPAAAPQPAEGVRGEDDHGVELPTAVRELARGIEEAALRGDTDRLVALCDPCSAAEHAWIRAADGTRTVLRAIRTHPMRLSTGGELVYPSLGECADDPGQATPCTPQQLQDAAVLGPKAKSGLGRSYSLGGAVRVPLTLRIEGGTARWTGIGAG